jgi:hypothetical protein
MARIKTREGKVGGAPGCSKLERRKQLHLMQEATRPAVWPMYDRTSNDDPAPIEKGWMACRYGDGEIECRYCQRIVPSTEPFSTCPACATKWREAFGPRWPEEPFHTELEADHMHFLYTGRVARRLPMVDEVDEHGAIEMVGLDNVLTVPEELWGIRGANQEIYSIIRDLRQARDMGAKAILTELRQMNAERIAAGREPLKEKSLQTIQYWLRRINAETAGVANESKVEKQAA